MTDSDTISARYANGKYIVSYNFASSKNHVWQVYDRIEIRELLSHPSSGGGSSATTTAAVDDDDNHSATNNNVKDQDNSIIIAAQVTNSTLSTDVVEIPSTNGGSAASRWGSGYCYASFINATEDKEIARSDLFLVDKQSPLDDEKNNESTFVLEEEREICTLELVRLDKVLGNANDSNEHNCELTIEWEFQNDLIGKDVDVLKNHLSYSDWIVVLPSCDSEYLKNHYHEGAFVMASGKMSGTVNIRIGGYCKPDGIQKYQVFYYDTGLSVCRGSSEPFTIDSTFFPLPIVEGGDDDQNAEDVDAAMRLQAMRNQSHLFNNMAVMRYEIQNQMNSMKKDSSMYNPLLTVLPKPGKWEQMMKEYEKEHSFPLEEENVSSNLHSQPDTLAQHDTSSALVDRDGGPIKDKEVEMNVDINVDEDVALSDTMIRDIVANMLKEKTSFLFLGAGISMAAPSSAPSWWSLMSNVLEETFKAVPMEHQNVARKLATTDASRSPEEVMETYYFVLQDKLFTLFQLLNEGKPNANHRIVAKMAKAGKLRSVLTTNFDEFIEQALDEEGGIPYKVICTADEFKTYLDDGCDGFAILKIHGTVSRPDTIVAVANHYKGGKGFGGVKAIVTHYFLKNYPTIFLGYSGWDFEHANYQEFWKNVGKEGGEMIYFMKLKGSKGGPNISKLVGRHIGQRLVIGEAVMPNFLCSVMTAFNQNDSVEIMEFHHKHSSDVGHAIAMKQKEYITNWVHSFSKVAILAILWNESSNLNEIMKSRMERMKNTKDETEPVATNTDGLAAYMMQLSTQYTQGTITEHEYMQKQQRATLEITLSNVSIGKEKKEKLITLLCEEMDSNPLFQGTNGNELKSMFPSYIMMSADACDSDASPRDIFDLSLKYVTDVLLPLYVKKEADRASEILYNMRYMHSVFLRIESNESKEEAETLIEAFAKDAMEKRWSDDVISEKNAKEVIPALTRIAFQQIDTKALMKSQVSYVLELVDQESSVDEILDSAFIIAISMERQAQYLSSDLYGNTTMMQILQMMAINEDKVIPQQLFETLIDDLSKDVEPVMNVLRCMDADRKKGEKLSPKEVLATFDLAFVKTIQLCLKHIGNGAQIQSKREGHGYYPFDHLPATASMFLSKRMEEASKYIEDDRAEQSALAMLVSLGEVTRNVDQMQKAVDASLKITEGKVTELTPPPIPEALAAVYQEEGNLEKALYYYLLSLDGIQTFVMREKTDAIVLNACLIMATYDKMAALRTAFDYSPFFSEVQMNILPKAGRSLLVQQCKEWAKELGMELSEARRILTRSQELELKNEDHNHGNNVLRDVDYKNPPDDSTDIACHGTSVINDIYALEGPDASGIIVRNDNDDLFAGQETATTNNFQMPSGDFSSQPTAPFQNIAITPEKKSNLDGTDSTFKPALMGDRTCGSCLVM